MPDDFLKKINSNKSQSGQNPLDKLFQSKKVESRPVAQNPAKREDSPNSMDGIENLGKSPTSKERYVETPQTEETKPAQTNQIQPAQSESAMNEDAGGLELEALPRGLQPEERIPAKNLENADIFASNEAHGNFLSNVSSSTNDLSFDEEAAAANAEKTKRNAAKAAELLLANKKEEAIKFIQENF
ncbi:MAG: hypothetical protein PHW02_03460 [bacterium]|nr:hypothetical protein [bacterium]